MTQRRYATAISQTGMVVVSLDDIPVPSVAVIDQFGGKNTTFWVAVLVENVEMDAAGTGRDAVDENVKVTVDDRA